MSIVTKLIVVALIPDSNPHCLCRKYHRKRMASMVNNLSWSTPTYCILSSCFLNRKERVYLSGAYLRFHPQLTLAILIHDAGQKYYVE